MKITESFRWHAHDLPVFWDGSYKLKMKWATLIKFCCLSILIFHAWSKILLSFQMRTWKALWVTSSGCFWALQIYVTWQILDNFVRCWTVSMLCDQLIASLESSHYYAVLFNFNNSMPDLISGWCYRMVLLLLTKYICFNQSRDKLCISKGLFLI